MSRRSLSTWFAASGLILILVVILSVTILFARDRTSDRTSDRTKDSAEDAASLPGLAPPAEGTVPMFGNDPDEVHTDGIRPVPLPLDAEVPHTRSTWPNVRVDQALYAPEETGIVIDPTDPNRLMAVAQGGGCYYFYSSDAGATWEEGSIDDPYDLGDPTIAVDADGTAYYAYIGSWSHSGIFVAKSTNGGVSWQPGVPVIEHSSSVPFEDKEYLVCERTTGAYYSGSIYIAWTQFDTYGSSDPADSTRILFSYSRDQATTFAPPIRVSDQGGNCIDSDDTVEGAVPAAGLDGSVYLAWAGPRGIEFDRSLDGGQTWGTDQVISDMPGGWAFPVPGIYRCNGLPSTKVDISDGPYAGRLYVLWSDQRNGDTDVFLIHSDDGGETWSPRLRVNGDPVGNGRHQFFPWMDVDPVTGHLYIVYYDRRETTGNDTEVWLAVSRDGGATFAEEVISQSPFTPSQSVFFGDYIGISAWDGRVRPFWMRLDGNQMSVWTALVEIDNAAVGDPLPSSRVAILPNPAGSEARIFAWSMAGQPEGPSGTLRVFSADGRVVRSFPATSLSERGTEIWWDLRDENGRRVPSGTYLVRAPGGGTSRVLVTR